MILRFFGSRVPLWLCVGELASESEDSGFFCSRVPLRLDVGELGW